MNPYAGSAFVQLEICLSMTGLEAPRMARAVFSKSTFCCAGDIKRKRLPGCEK